MNGISFVGFGRSSIKNLHFLGFNVVKNLIMKSDQFWPKVGAELEHFVFRSSVGDRAALYRVGKLDPFSESSIENRDSFVTENSEHPPDSWRSVETEGRWVRVIDDHVGRRTDAQRVDVFFKVMRSRQHF